MKGIILAGGSGSRLFPLTLVTNKHLLPVYDKPMICYPLSTLMLGEIRDILLISAPGDLPHFRRLFGDGSAFGVRLSYAEQPSPDGLAQAFLIGRSFIENGPCAMILGDNIFYGDRMPELLRSAAVNAEKNRRATVFGCPVEHPERFGVVTFDRAGRAVSIEEKPEHPGGNCAVTGLYYYPAGVSYRAAQVGVSPRGEMEISTLNEMYLRDGLLDVRLLGEEIAWTDAGTTDSLADATAFVRDVQTRRGAVIAAPEAIAYEKGWIGRRELLAAAKRFERSAYGAYLQKAAKA